MPPKHPSSSKASCSEPKWQRKMLTIVDKVKLLDMLKEGKKFVDVGRYFTLILLRGFPGSRRVPEPNYRDKGENTASLDTSYFDSSRFST
ncbi:hypothetical protein SK128_000768 [Halocaridina rubra]|uniref:Uncharacterized protein n=1 Tax=Halocaridina rubra TaxID=373956 RepID=A0AAN8X8F1_HALRR